MWFAPQEWARIADRLARFTWDPDDFVMEAGRHVPLSIPAFGERAEQRLGARIEGGAQVVVQAEEHDGSDPVGVTVEGLLAGGPGWNDWVFTRYVHAHPLLQTLPGQGVAPEATWAALCAHFGVAAYVEVTGARLVPEGLHVPGSTHASADPHAVARPSLPRTSFPVDGETGGNGAPAVGDEVDCVGADSEDLLIGAATGGCGSSSDNGHGPGGLPLDVFVISPTGEVWTWRDAHTTSTPGEREALRHAVLAAQAERPPRLAGVTGMLVRREPAPPYVNAAADEARTVTAEVEATRHSADGDEQDNNGIEAMLARAERNIVQYSDEDLHAAWFDTAAELEARLAEIMSISPLRLQVRELDVDAFELVHSRRSKVPLSEEPSGTLLVGDSQSPGQSDGDAPGALPTPAGSATAEQATTQAHPATDSTVAGHVSPAQDSGAAGATSPPPGSTATGPTTPAVPSGEVRRALAVASKKMVLAEAHRIGVEYEDGFTRFWIPHAFEPWDGEEFWSENADRFAIVGELDVVCDGPVIRSLHTEFCGDTADFEPFLCADARLLGVREADRWFVLSVPGTPTCFPFPRDSTMVDLHLDDDGARLSLRLRHDTERLKHLRSVRDFRVRWADWLNENHALSEAELAEGVRDIETRLAAMVQEERA